jgi:rhamnosyltransferase
MKIGIIGSRGIPAKYGGFEVFAEQLSTRLVEKGYLVDVGCEHIDSKNIDKYRGVNLCYFPFPPHKLYQFRKFYEIFNDVYFMIKLSKLCDVVYILGTGAGVFLFILKILNRKVKILVNIDGLDWKRDKFNRFEKMLLKFNTYIATVFADNVVLDAKSMGYYISKPFKRKTVFIPYGVECPDAVVWDKTKLEILSQGCSMVNEINQNDYWLVVARLEPENNIHIILEGYLMSNSKRLLVVVGDYTGESYRKAISKILYKNNNKNRLLIVGPIYEDKRLLNMLRQNCFAYIHGHSVGGTNPSFLEAMSMKNIIVAHDNEFNREVAQDTAMYFKDANELKDMIELIENKTEVYAAIKNQAHKRVLENYSWDVIVSRYNKLFTSLGDNK